MITDLNQINTGTEEGKMLLAALAKITTESQTDKTPYEVLDQLNELKDKMKFTKVSYTTEVYTRDQLSARLLELYSQIKDEKSMNPFLYRDIERWYNEIVGNNLKVK